MKNNQKFCGNWTLRFSSKLTWSQPLSAAYSKSFSFNHAICIPTLHCSVCFIICGTALKTSAIIHYEWALLFYLQNQKYLWHTPFKCPLKVYVKTGSGHQSWKNNRLNLGWSSCIVFVLTGSHKIKCIQWFWYVQLNILENIGKCGKWAFKKKSSKIVHMQIIMGLVFFQVD